MQEQLNDVIVK